jgi:hypothetical protein
VTKSGASCEAGKRERCDLCVRAGLELGLVGCRERGGSGGALPGNGREGDRTGRRR